jgi:hypothetical protein
VNAGLLGAAALELGAAAVPPGLELGIARHRIATALRRGRHVVDARASLNVMPRLPRRIFPLLTVCTRCVPGALARLQTSSEVSKAFAHSTTLTKCVLCARLPPLVFFSRERMHTRARSARPH